MTNIEQLENLVARPYVSIPLMHKDLYNVKVYSEFTGFPEIVKAISRHPYTGDLILEFYDGNHAEGPIDETVAERIINQVRLISDKKKGSYKPTMTSRQKEAYLRHYHGNLFQKKKNEIEAQMDDEHQMFCLCGKLATGLHTMYCNKWKNHLTTHTLQALKERLPKLEAIKLAV